LIEVNYAVEFVAFQHRPTSPLGRVHLVVAVPGRFDHLLAVPYRQAAVHVAVNVAEMKLTVALLVELDVALFLNELLVPGTHRDDPPAVCKGLGAFAYFAIVLLHFVQVIRQVPSSIRPVAVQWLSSEL
jgi:hypothetical protein